MEQVISYVASMLLGVTAIGVLVDRAQVARKYLTLAAQVVLFIDEILKALDDKALTPDEVKKLAADASAIKEAFKLVRGK